MMFESRSNGALEAIPRIEDATASDVREQLKSSREPVIFAGLTRDWTVVREWTPEYLKDRYGDVLLDVCLHLPTKGAPYDCDPSEHAKSMRFADFVEHLLSTSRSNPCYMAEKDIRLFPGAEEDLGFDKFAPKSDQASYTRLWVGSSGTRSGLHFDRFDNFLGQVYGSKWVLLASQKESGFLYPYIDYVQKSQVDPDNPDLGRFHEYSKARMVSGLLRPGDVLFIPTLWWHYVRSEEMSVSVNYWFGRSASLTEQLSTVIACPPKYWWRTVRDFVWLGCLNKPYKHRLFSEAPTGKYLYDQCIGYRFRRKAVVSS